MIRGRLEPELAQLHSYIDPVEVALRYDDMDKDPFPTPQEAQVWFKLGRGPQDRLRSSV